MSKDVRFIEITFENLDYVVIPAHYFREFELTDIRTTVRRAAANAILKCTVVNSVMFELDPEVNKDAAAFEGSVYCISTGEGSLFDRLQNRDITQMKLIYADKTEEEFSVAWEDEENDEYRNRLQRTLINSAGQLCVQIMRSSQ